MDHGRPESHHQDEDLREAQRQHLFPCVTTYYREPLVIARASGRTVIDAEGREYLDFFGGILTVSLGHCQPEVVSRVQEQVARLGHTSTLYVTEPQINVARMLSEIAPGDALTRCFFTNSGSEAVETAVMTARLHTGRHDVIALRHGYSGRTTLTTSLNGQAPWRPLGGSATGIHHAASPYPYRCPLDTGDVQACEDYFIRDLQDVIETVTNGKPAAFLAETIQGVGGFIVPPPGYFRRAAELIRSHGGLFICDEVQAGFGRTGSRWFGIEHWGVEPDIMVMAKGIANGFPVGATITTRAIASSWTGKTLSTFGGTPISMAAAEATIETMRREDTPSRSAIRGAQLRSGLDALAAEFPWIGEVRGMGLMQALEIVEDPKTKKPGTARATALMEAAREEGLLVGLGGLHGHIIRIGPPMLITEAEVASGLERLAAACRKADKVA